MRTNYYVGGSLFTDKQIAQRIKEEEMLNNLDGAHVYNPITNDEINDKTQEPTSEDIFIQDTLQILRSDIILADLDDTDEGLAMELGIAYGCNYFLDMIHKAMEADEPKKYLKQIIDSVPEKRIYATCSDIRQDTDNESGKYKSWGQNQYLIGGIESMGEVHRNFDSVYKRLVENDFHVKLIQEEAHKKYEEEEKARQEAENIGERPPNMNNHTDDGAEVQHPYGVLVDEETQHHQEPSIANEAFRPKMNEAELLIDCEDSNEVE